jgi:spoIIIJ-associated protein
MHGKNLDALQVLVNVYAGNLADGPIRVVVDSENYRNRREDHLVRLAMKTAQQVRRSRTSRLLEPMNPFERRLIHTALSDMDDIHTESEGDGLIKQVRVSYVDR